MSDLAFAEWNRSAYGYSNNTSGCTGVAWIKENNRWWAYICINNSTINLGYFIDYNEAVKVRKEAEIKYFGEYRNKS